MRHATVITDLMAYSPVFVREFRVQMRRPWLYLATGLYLCALIPAGLYFLYHYASVGDADLHVDLSPRVQQGAILFALVLFAAQFVLITLLAPSFTNGAFAGERARGTLMPLLMTPLSTRSVVVEKWQASLMALLMLLLSTVPLCAVSSLFGGISPLDLLAGYGTLVGYALLLTAFGLYVSARCRHAGQAIVWTYVAVFVAPLLFPFILIPYAGIASWLVTGESMLMTTITRDLPLPLLAIPVLALTWLLAQWFIGESCAILDEERHLWGTYPPPMSHETTPPAAPLPEAVPTARRW